MKEMMEKMKEKMGKGEMKEMMDKMMSKCCADMITEEKHQAAEEIKNGSSKEGGYANDAANDDEDDASLS